MKRLWQGLFICCLGLIFMFAGINSANATDVWVAHWSDDNIDIYVMNDTLTYGSDSNGKGFSIATKFVKNGQLQKVVTWHFGKFRDGMWRYRTNTMSGNHDTVVIPQNEVFEYGMNQIGWSYYIKDRFYYY